MKMNPMLGRFQGKSDVTHLRAAVRGERAQAGKRPRRSEINKRKLIREYLAAKRSLLRMQLTPTF